MTYQYRKGVMVTHKTYVNLICNQGVRGSSPCGGTIFTNNFNHLGVIVFFDLSEKCHSKHIVSTAKN